jgi:capsular exopolysaccharide synthesis family protein
MTFSRKKDRSSGGFSSGMTTVLDPSSRASEAYRSLRTRLLSSYTDEPPKVILLTSPGPKEGKSVTCANLGVVLAQAHMNTLVWDCDLRKPMIHRLFEMKNTWGTSDVLLGGCSLESIWEEQFAGLKVVAAGAIPPSPTELLGSDHAARAFEHARQEFDYVLVDSPPVGLVSDPAILARQADAVIVVVDAQNTSKTSLRQCMRSLNDVGANVLGTVMNNVEALEGYYHSGGYGY